MSPARSQAGAPRGAALERDMVDEDLLELCEAIIAAHKAAVRDGDQPALVLIEPLLRHVGLRLVSAFGPLHHGHDGKPARDPSLVN